MKVKVTYAITEVFEQVLEVPDEMAAVFADPARASDFGLDGPWAEALDDGDLLDPDLATDTGDGETAVLKIEPWSDA